MSDSERPSQGPYADRLRLRVCGLLVRKDRLLMVKMQAPTREEPIWMPPGGGVDFGEPARKALKREMREETGIAIKVGALRYVHEFLEPPYHAMELYFDCHYEAGKPKLGSDPETEDRDTPAMLRDLQFMPIYQLKDHPVEPAFIREDFPQTYRLKPAGPAYYEQGEEVTEKQ